MTDPLQTETAATAADEATSQATLGVADANPAGKPLREFIQRLNRLLPLIPEVDWVNHLAATWHVGRWQTGFLALPTMALIELDDLLHIDRQKQQIIANTAQFVAGLPANNCLLWGARGTGKSSLVQGLLGQFGDQGLRMVEVSKDHLADMSEILAELARLPYRFIVFCDDLSFEADDASYKSLKSALDGALCEAAANVLIYATSNRRHLLVESAADNTASTMQGSELHPSEGIEEKISLSDRFGLWLSFYPYPQPAYLDMVRRWVDKLAEQHGLTELQGTAADPDERAAALRFALGRGVRSGRTAQHFARAWVGAKLLERQGADF